MSNDMTIACLDACGNRTVVCLDACGNRTAHNQVSEPQTLGIDVCEWVGSMCVCSVVICSVGLCLCIYICLYVYLCKGAFI